MNILEIINLKTYFYTSGGVVKAVDDISFDIEEGKTLGLVGESGSGKTITALSVMRLIDSPGKIAGGVINFRGKPLLGLNAEDMRLIRGSEISIVFQEPLTSLNPVLTIGEQMKEAILAHKRMGSKECEELMLKSLDKVNIASSGKILKDYPHNLSGGMRQRVMLATALLLNPKLIILDEPTTALDVTIQASILDLLKELKKQMNLSILFITHDLGIIADIADEVVIMENGKLVEKAGVSDIFERPKADYTKRLLDAARFLEVTS